MRLPHWFTTLILSLHAISAPEERTSKVSQRSLNNTISSIPSISTFATYVHQTNLQLFSDDNTAHQKVTLFVPTNEAISALQIKPHEGPRSKARVELTESAYRARRNKLASEWILAHTAATYPLSFATGYQQSFFNASRLKFHLTEGDEPEWHRVTVNGAWITKQYITPGGEIYIVPSALFDWGELRDE